jgi:hypothetical protein
LGHHHPTRAPCPARRRVGGRQVGWVGAAAGRRCSRPHRQADPVGRQAGRAGLLGRHRRPLGRPRPDRSHQGDGRSPGRARPATGHATGQPAPQAHPHPGPAPAAGRHRRTGPVCGRTRPQAGGRVRRPPAGPGGPGPGRRDHRLRGHPKARPRDHPHRPAGPVRVPLGLPLPHPQASDTILGSGWASLGYAASTIDAADRGVGLLLAEGGLPVRLRACWLDDDQLAVLAARAEALRAGPPRNGPGQATVDRQPDREDE